ncbi:ribonuclease HI [Fervidobacterium gondwanense]|uniref:Ribonuclease HI n=1 Tax=Fervidobacterium gondwanense DSM 13020 TaxID=1121883 RepID=A0A1M7T753_FERGO|nr:RNase H family protein [Fervidobacterium gondwanense]SHN66571.1 ribonuclease HI [Fervidobacterium gondwanense DSM 13020]
MLKVYTDGSYKNGFVSYGFLLSSPVLGGEQIVAKVSKATTELQNVEAELKAALYALNYVKQEKLDEKFPVIVLCSDIDIIKKALSGKVNSQNPEVVKYVEELKNIAKSLKCRLCLEKVRGHENHVHNKLDIHLRRKINRYIAERTQAYA